MLPRYCLSKILRSKFCPGYVSQKVLRCKYCPKDVFGKPVRGWQIRLVKIALCKPVFIYLHLKWHPTYVKPRSFTFATRIVIDVFPCCIEGVPKLCTIVQFVFRSWFLGGQSSVVLSKSVDFVVVCLHIAFSSEIVSWICPLQCISRGATWCEYVFSICLPRHQSVWNLSPKSVYPEPFASNLSPQFVCQGQICI